eukprot:2660764-Rhodomonas_salina.1
MCGCVNWTCLHPEPNLHPASSVSKHSLRREGGREGERERGREGGRERGREGESLHARCEAQ